MSNINRLELAVPKRTDAAAAPKGRAKGNSVRDAKLLEAAQQFETLFTQQLLQSLRKMVPESSMFPKGPGNTMYDHMMDSNVAEHMSKSRGTGIADFLYRQWTGKSMPLQTTVEKSGGVIHSIPSVDSPAAVTPDKVPVPARLDAEEIVPANNLKDNSSKSLRNDLPPSGIEENNDFFLNDCNERHVPQSGDLSQWTREESPIRGNENGYKTKTSGDSNRQINIEGPGIRAAAAQSGERWRAVNEYRSADNTRQGGHQHNLQSSGVGQARGSETT